jgi:proline iminopeptidase
MGFSWGCGLIASYMLEKKPAGVKALILSAPLLSTSLWDRDQREHITKMPSAMIKAIENGERSGDYTGEYQTAMMAYYNRHVCRLNPWPDSLLEALDGLNMDVYQTMWGPSEFTVTGKLKDFDLYPRLHEITIPVLLTCGDNDEAGVKTLKDFQMAFPQAQMAVIPNASHLHQIEQPQIYKIVVNEFLKNQ